LLGELLAGCVPSPPPGLLVRYGEALEIVDFRWPIGTIYFSEPDLDSLSHLLRS
jgi:hypothetical protein